MNYIKPQCKIKHLEGASPLAASPSTIGQVDDNKTPGAKGHTPFSGNTSDDWLNDGQWPSNDSK